MQNALWIVVAIIIIIALLIITINFAIRFKELKKTIAKLEYFEALVDSAPVYIAYDNLDSKDMYANLAAWEMVGKPVGKALSKEEVHGDEGVRILQEEAFPAVDETGVWLGDNVIVHSDGRLIDVQQFAFIVKNKAGEKLGVATLMRDTTEEKAMQRELDIQSSIINSSGNFILALDTNMNIVYASPGVYEMSGYDRDEIGLDFSPALFHRPETVENVFFRREAALEEENIFEIESEFIRKDGSEIDVMHRFFNVKDKDGQVIGAGGILSDISELKNIQRELIAAKEEAEAANKAKSLFLSSMSHEIRTPLNAIIGMAHIISASPSEEEKVTTLINEVMVASDHLLELLNNILDVAKIESGEFTLSYEPFLLRSALDEVVNIFTYRCKERFISLVTEFDNLSDSALKGDKLRIKQILINLLGNAVKFTGAGGTIKLFVSEAKIGDRCLLRIVVSDTGIGMKEEDIPRLFTAFNQGSDTITEQYGGTGLGLAISQNLVNQMGGEITVESKFGEGTSFSFSIELEISDEIIIEEVSENIQIPDLSGKRILIAEDIDINRLVIEELLAETKASIDFAMNGLEAVDMFTQSLNNFYDLIIMDIQMPVMNGYEASQKIRSISRDDATSVPIFAMTANAYSEDVEKAFESGMNGHLAKPIDLEAMYKVLSQI